METGERMLIPCVGGPALSRLVVYPPPLEVPMRDGVYVLLDDGPVEEWCYEFVADSSSSDARR